MMKINSKKPILHPQEGDVDQEIRDEIRTKEEQFNE